MRAFVVWLLRGAVGVVSACAIGIGGVLMLLVMLGIYCGGIWLGWAGMTWAGHAVEYHPVMGYSVLLLSQLALCAWIPGVGVAVALFGTIGAVGVLIEVVQTAQRMVLRDRS